MRLNSYDSQVCPSQQEQYEFYQNLKMKEQQPVVNSGNAKSEQKRNNDMHANEAFKQSYQMDGENDEAMADDTPSSNGLPSYPQ